MSARQFDIIELHHPQDVVLARQRVRQVAQELGFRDLEQARIATAVSEIARNAFRYAKAGDVDISVEGEPGQQHLAITVRDRGPGIPHLDDVFSGDYVSETGMGQGIVGARRLMEDFEIESDDEGTTVRMRTPLPSRALPIDEARARQISQRVVTGKMDDEFHHQNIELRRALEELNARNDELNRLSRELEDTNRGVVALYTELEDRAEQLRRANEIQAQFMSYMSHEFRSPLDSMIGLANLLSEQVDGPISEEQVKQANLISRSARDLLRIVDDLLDSARAEAGKIQIRPSSFLVSDMFNALRATLRPVLATDDTALEFIEDGRLPPLFTDETRLSQILRNLITNALKFTEAGRVIVIAKALPNDVVEFQVRDTGIGIDQANIAEIFKDFGQVESPLQRKRKGTGLGLPLSRKLAELLGGELEASSQVGVGSTFTVRIPASYAV